MLLVLLAAIAFAIKRNSKTMNKVFEDERSARYTYGVGTSLIDRRLR